MPKRFSWPTLWVCMEQKRELPLRLANLRRDAAFAP